MVSHYGATSPWQRFHISAKGTGWQVIYGVNRPLGSEQGVVIVQGIQS